MYDVGVLLAGKCHPDNQSGDFNISYGDVRW